MLIMPFIVDSWYLFSVCKASDTSPSDTGMLSVFQRLWLPIVLFIGGRRFQSLTEELQLAPLLRISF